MNRSLNPGTLARHSAGGDGPAPGTQVVWLHATSTLRLQFLCDITGALAARRDNLGLVATYDPARVDVPAALGNLCDLVMALPPSGGGQGRQMINAWRPSLVLWSGGPVNPALIRHAHDPGTRLILVDADKEEFQSRKRRWFPGPLQDAMRRFTVAFANSEAAADALRRVGMPADRIEISGPLHAVPTPPGCADEELADVTRELSGRPVWLAAFAHPDEFDCVVTAQRNAVRHAHRLLLVIVLDNPAWREKLLALLDRVTLRHAVWHPGDPIDDHLQVLVAEDPGLWYRIAPQTFLGHSLIAGEGGRDPLPAAALGSAVVHGPNVRAHSDAYCRLTTAGAAQLVTDGNTMGVQVARLVSPELVAGMALAGWEVATKGAELTQKVIALCNDLLDRAGAAHACA